MQPALIQPDNFAMLGIPQSWTGTFGGSISYLLHVKSIHQWMTH